jgi:S1-C subfamily serine protease
VLGDLIVAVEGEPVRTSGELWLALERRSPGELVNVTVNRDGREVDVAVRLGDPQR